MMLKADIGISPFLMGSAEFQLKLELVLKKAF
jgi:hypothetical protein